MSKTTVVFYHVINDKEDKNSQNVFYISKPLSSITLSDVKNEFPLIGTYHFRFKVVYSNSHAWADINDESSFIPSFNSCIYTKVLRLSWMDRKCERENRIETDGERKEDEEKHIKKEKGKEKEKEREIGRSEKEKEKPHERSTEKEKRRENSLEKIINDHEKIKFHKREKILYESKERNLNDANDFNKLKNNVDMLLFETSPHNKHSNVNKSKRTDGDKEQNYFDLMFN